MFETIKIAEEKLVVIGKELTRLSELGNREDVSEMLNISTSVSDITLNGNSGGEITSPITIYLISIREEIIILGGPCDILLIDFS